MKRRSAMLLKTMINRNVFSFLKNFLIFLIDRLYKEWRYMIRVGRSSSERASERGDLYAQHLIENIIHDRARKYDPYILDGNAAISSGTSSVVLGKARVTGISSLHRTNICSLTDEGNRLFINANLGAGPLTYQRQIILRFGDLERKTSIMVSAIDVKVSVDFSVEKETGRNGFLLNFAVNELKGFKLNVNVSGYFGRALNFFLNFWAVVLSRIVRNLLENELEQYILNRLPKYQFPVEGTSYRNETKLNNQHEDIKNNEASLLETFHMKQSQEKTEWFRLSPISKSSLYDEYNYSAEKETAKNYASNQETMKTSECFPETNRLTTEIGSYLTSQPLCKNSYEVSKDKVEGKCDFISELSLYVQEISRSVNNMTKKLASKNDITDSWSKELASKNSLKFLEDDCSFFDRDNTSKLIDIDEVKHNSESTVSESSSPSTDSENEDILSERWRKSKDDYFEMIEDKRNSEAINENRRRSELLEKCLVHKSAFGMGNKLPSRVANCDSTLSTKLDSSRIDKSVLESTSTENATFLDTTRYFDSEMWKARIDDLEKVFIAKKRKRKNQHVSFKDWKNCQSPENLSARNLELKLRSEDMLRNEPLISCTVDEFEKHLNVFPNLSRGYESQIKDLESIKSNRNEISRNRSVEALETRCIVDGRARFGSDIISDSIQQKLIQDEKSFDLEADIEAIYSNLEFSVEHENEINEEIPFKCVKVRTGEEELNEHSELKENEGYEDNASNNEIISFGFTPQNLVLCSGSSQNNSSDEVSEDEIIEKGSHLGSYSEDTMEICSPFPTTNSWFVESCMLEKPACFNKIDTECTDCRGGFSLSRMELNENTNKNNFIKTSDLKPLPDLLQEEIIAKTRKLISDVASESDPEDNEYSSSTPISSSKNLKYPKEEFEEVIRDYYEKILNQTWK